MKPSKHPQEKLTVKPVRAPESAFLTRLARKVGWWFRKEIVEPRCISFLDHESLVLPARILSSAEHFEITFTIRRPLHTWAGATFYSVRLIPGNLRMFICEPWLRRRKFSRMEADWEITTSRSWWKSLVQVRFAAGIIAGRNHLALEVWDERNGVPIGRLPIDVIDVERAQRLRIESLRATNRRLWIQSSGRWYLGEQKVADSSDFVVPEFTLGETEFSALLPACEIGLELTLRSNHQNVSLEKRRLTLGRHAVKVTANPVPLRTGNLLPVPGDYSIEVFLENRMVGHFPFRVITRQEWLHEAEVPAIDLEAESPDGRNSRAVGALDWGRHVAFQPAFWIRTQVPGPDILINCVERILLDEEEIDRHEFLVFMKDASQRVKLPRFEIKPIGARNQSSPMHLLLTVHLNNELKIAAPVVVIPPERISNFEGQLNRKINELPVDEAAYREILSRLMKPPVADGKSD